MNTKNFPRWLVSFGRFKFETPRERNAQWMANAAHFAGFDVRIADRANFTLQTLSKQTKTLEQPHV